MTLFDGTPLDGTPLHFKIAKNGFNLINDTSGDVSYKLMKHIQNFLNIISRLYLIVNVVVLI